jgi:hypothetical protein
LTIDAVEAPAGERKTVYDPCGGSGRLLLAAADIQPHWEFVGQDVDLRCVRMTANNLALRNRYGYAILGNLLLAERRLVYRTGFNLRGFLRELPPDEPLPYSLAIPEPAPQTTGASARCSSTEPPVPAPTRQLHLF